MGLKIASNFSFSLLMFQAQRVISSTFLNFIAILLGFFLSINLSTVLGQTGDWGILSSGIFVASLEVFSEFFYKVKKNLIASNFKFGKNFILVVEFFNSLKIGVLYGFFVESFKLGS